MKGDIKDKLRPWFHAVVGSIIIVIGITIGNILLMISADIISCDSLAAYLFPEVEQQVANTILRNDIVCLLQYLILIVLAMILFRVFVKEPLKNMGLTSFKTSWKDFFVGLVLGAFTMLLVFVMMLLTKNISVVGLNKFPVRWFVINFVLYTGVGFGEEIICRGYLMSCLRNTGNKYIALIIPSIAFSMLHLGNPGIGVLPLINLVLFGICISYAYYLSGNIWLPIGFHITWNFFEGNIFGFLVSGGNDKGVIELKTASANLINGGDFGPEGGLIVTFIIILMFFGFKFIYRNSTYKFIK